jgi:hypothetical protein
MPASPTMASPTTRNMVSIQMPGLVNGASEAHAA